MRDLLRKSPKFFAGALLAGLALRLCFVSLLPQVTDDSRIYADIARNWLRHGIYGVTAAGSIVPTYIRLPGYPAFLAIIFGIFGDNNFRAVFLAQIAFDLGTCLLIADLARRIAGERAAKAAFLLAALCPFLANYAAAVLTETLEIFFSSLALDLAVIGLERLAQGSIRAWIGCGLAISACIYMRPDGGLLLPSIGLYLCYLLGRKLLARAGRDVASNVSTGKIIWAGAILVVFSLGPLAPWTVRNLRTMHAFQPLAPRYANEPDEFVPMGFNRWVRTWIVDYASVQEIYWQEPGAKIDAGLLPARAFDSPEQKQRTLQALDQYNETTDIDSELDRKFESLAQDRIHGHLFRYYFWLPAMRIADMWLRPRTELLPADPRWWEFNDDAKWITVSVIFGVINLIYLLLAIKALTHGRSLRWLTVLLAFVTIRSLFLGTLENPEPRYTLECDPVVLGLAGAAFVTRRNSTAAEGVSQLRS